MTFILYLFGSQHVGNKNVNTRCQFSLSFVASDRPTSVRAKPFCSPYIQKEPSTHGWALRATRTWDTAPNYLWRPTPRWSLLVAGKIQAARVATTALIFHSPLYFTARGRPSGWTRTFVSERRTAARPLTIRRCVRPATSRFGCWKSTDSWASKNLLS